MKGLHFEWYLKILSTLPEPLDEGNSIWKSFQISRVVQILKVAPSFQIQD